MACSVWNVRRTPQRARRKCGIASRSVPKARTVPDAGRTNPDSTLKKVVLPAPFGPIRPQVPCSKTRFMLSSEVTPPYRTVRPEILIMPTPLPPGPCPRASHKSHDQPPSLSMSFGNWSAMPAGAVVSTWITPTPNKIVSHAYDRPSSAGRRAAAA